MVVTRVRLVVVLVALVIGLGLAPAVADETPAPDPVNTAPPTVAGIARWGENLTAQPGTWDPADVQLTYRWLRNGEPIPGEIGTVHRINDGHDLGKRLSIRVTPVGRPDLAVESEPTAVTQRATFTSTARPAISGTLKFRKTLKASTGRWSRGALTYKYRWFSGGKPVSGATKSSFTLRPADVGHTVRVEVTASRPGFTTKTVTSRSTTLVQHLSRLRKTVTYSVVTRGKVTQSLSTFKKLAQETFDDPRGWRGNGIAFRRVSKGGDFTLVLSRASKVPSFSSACSSRWSCRVGRYVVINQDRWRSASPAWNARGGSLRGYRDMVVNHETGHWLGRGHASCSGKGDLAPVMQQQSKGLGGCRFNPWPKSSELYSSRFRF